MPSITRSGDNAFFVTYASKVIAYEIYKAIFELMISSIPSDQLVTFLKNYYNWSEDHAYLMISRARSEYANNTHFANQFDGDYVCLQAAAATSTSKITSAEYYLIRGMSQHKISMIKFIRQQQGLSLYAAKMLVEAVLECDEVTV